MEKIRYYTDLLNAFLFTCSTLILAINIDSKQTPHKVIIIIYIITLIYFSLREYFTRKLLKERREILKNE